MASTPRPKGELNDAQLSMMLILIVSLMLVALIVRTAGDLTSRILGNGGMGLSAAELGGVFVKLVQHKGNVEAAFPAGEVTSAALFYSIVAVFLLAAVGLLIVAAKVKNKVFSKPASDDKSARWATASELEPLVVRSAEPGRLVLGRSGPKLLAAEPRQSVIILGPTQSMKTTGFAIPAILEWQGPVVATSVKTDLLRDTIGARRARGDVWVYDPTATTGYPGATWSPLQFCHDWHGAQRTADHLCRAARSDGLEDGDFWYQTAAKLLGPLMFAAARSGGTIKDVVRWVDSQEENEVKRVLLDLQAEEALRSAQAAWLKEPRQKGSIYTTAETVLLAYSDPIVASSAMSSEISPEILLDGGEHTLFISAPGHEQKRLRPIFETLVQSIVSYCFARASITGEPLDPPLLLVLDEAANIAPLRALDQYASTAAGQGVQLVTIWQDLAQIERIYGRAANTVVNNHRAKVVLSGISDPSTLEYASHLLGDEEVKYSSVTTGAQGERSRTESTGYRKLAPGHALRRIKPGEGVLVYGHLPPAQLKLRPWFREKTLTQLVEESMPRQLEIPEAQTI